MNNKPTLFSTLHLVHNLYKDKTDKQGTPYIIHLLNVMFNCLPYECDWLQIAALLHDVIEDELLTFDELEELGYEDTVIETVISLTRLPDETYFNYINHVKLIPIAKTIKIADLQDNLAKCNTPQFDSLKQRYEKALAILKDEVH